MAVRYSRGDMASPGGLLAALQTVFPDFGDNELVADIHSSEANLHTVMREFSSSFKAAEATPQQLTGLSSLLSEVVTATDELENAVGTCFLEHLRQIDPRGILWACLAAEVRNYVRTH